MTTRIASPVDLFLKVVGAKQGQIKGESKDGKHVGEIDINSYTWNVTQPYDRHSGGMATGKREHGLFVVKLHTQSASPKLMNACFTGEHLKEVVLTCRKAGGEQQEYMKWTLKTALITKFETLCDHETPVPTDQLSIAYRTIEIEYREQKADGTLAGTVMASDTWGG